ncbi:hypothetical protein BH09ACT8_BH09ACT8_06410 [soil metagenome]
MPSELDATCELATFLRARRVGRTRLEQGRGLRPWAEVVDAPARALRLGTYESTHLLGLVGHVLRGWNREICSSTTYFENSAPAERNLIRLCVLYPFLRAFYRDRADIMRERIADLRSAWAIRPDDPDLVRLVEEMNRESPEFAELWAQRDVRIRGEGTKRLCHPTHGPLDVRHKCAVSAGRLRLAHIGLSRCGRIAPAGTGPHRLRGNGHE